MAYIARGPRWSRRIAGTLTLVTAFVLVLISYAVAAGWTQPGIMNGSVSNDTPDETDSGAVLDLATLPPAAATRQAATRTPVSAESGHIPDGSVGIEDGYIPDGHVLSPWDTHHPAVGNLAPDLLDAVQQAAADADTEGIVMVVNSGWRSDRYQQALLDEAVVTYGSEAEARKWVNTPDMSSHVTGDGIDIGYTDADYWLIEHGYAYGLCQTYENEIWHFELAVEPGDTCPPPLRDASASVPGDPAVGTGPIPSSSRLVNANRANAALDDPPFSSVTVMDIAHAQPATTRRGRASHHRRIMST